MMEREVLKTKICLVGDNGVGKTSLIRRYVLDMFDDRYITTLGTKVSKKEVEVSFPKENLTAHVDMLIWDIMGQHGFQELLKEAYFYGARGILAVVDITRRLVDLGCYQVALSDTIGVGTPVQVRGVLAGGAVLLGVRSGFKTPDNLVTDEPLPPLVDYSPPWASNSPTSPTTENCAYVDPTMGALEKLKAAADLIESIDAEDIDDMIERGVSAVANAAADKLAAAITGKRTRLRSESRAAGKIVDVLGAKRPIERGDDGQWSESNAKPRGSSRGRAITKRGGRA